MTLSKEMIEMAEMEKQYAIKLDKDFRGWGNPAVDSLIEAIAYDSKKHAVLYRTVAYLVEGKNLSIIDIKYEDLEKSLRKHIETEEKMLKRVKELISKVENEGAKRLLAEIYSDEVSHHPFMKQLLKLVLKGDTITEEDVFNMVFRDLPTGGAPDPIFE
ncbi:ferritin family protein [Thermoproteota archaeon]